MDTSVPLVSNFLLPGRMRNPAGQLEIAQKERRTAAWPLVFSTH